MLAPPHIPPKPKGPPGANYKFDGRKWVLQSVTGDGVRPGSVKSPIAPLKLPGATDVKVDGMHIGTVDVVGLRNFLRSKGYDLPKSNSATMGRRLISALDNWGITKIPAKFGPKDAVTKLLQDNGWKPNAQSGLQKPKVWSQTYGQNRPKVMAPVNTILTRGGVPQSNPHDSVGTFDPSGLGAAADSVGSVPLDEALAKSGAQLIKDPQKLADALAGLQYDGELRDLNHAKDVNVRQTAQDLHDIGSWYDQALASRKTAATRDTAATAAGSQSVKDADAAIIASLGGDANGGATTIGDAAQASQGTLAAVGAAQDMFNADIQPIVTQERAGQLSAERAAGTKRNSDLATQIADVTGQRGGTVASRLFDIQQMNNSIRDNQLGRLLDIKNANNQLAQQNFNNTLAIQQANLAALATGAKLAASGAKPAKGSFAGTPASVKAQIAQRIFTDLQASGAKTPQAAQAIVAARLRGAGWDLTNPAVAHYGQALLSNWQQTQQ